MKKIFGNYVISLFAAKSKKAPKFVKIMETVPKYQQIMQGDNDVASNLIEDKLSNANYCQPNEILHHLTI